MSRIIHNQRANSQDLSLYVRNKSDKSDSKASGNSKGPGNNNNTPGKNNGPGNGNGSGNGHNGNGNGNGNGGQGNTTPPGNPNPTTTPATPSPTSVGGGSGGGTSSGNGGGDTTSGGSGSNPSPNDGGSGSSPTSLPGSLPTTTDTGGNASNPPNKDSGGDNTSSKSGPQPGSGEPTNGASDDSAGSNMPATKSDKISDSSPSYRTTFSSYTYTSVFTSVTTISSGGQAYTSSFVFTSVGVTSIPVSGLTGVPSDGDSGATTHQPNIGAIVGAVIGSLVGLLLLLLLIFLYRRRRRDDISFSMINPLTEDEQDSRVTASPIQINMSHVTETDYSKHGAPPSPLASLFNKARHRSSQPFFRPMSIQGRRVPTQQTSTLENPFRDHPAPPSVTITNPFADPDASGAGETSSHLSTFTDISSMLLPSDYSGAAVEFSNSATVLRQHNEAILSEAPAARSSEAVIEMARRLSEIPVLDISSTAAHARKSSELFPDIPNATPGPSRNNSTHREPQNLESSRVTELYGIYPSEQSRRSSRADNRYSKTSSNRSIRWGFAS